MEGLGRFNARVARIGVMEIFANGKPREVQSGETVAGLLSAFGWKPEWVVVEINGHPLERAGYVSTQLTDGDRLEIVRAVAGGA